MENIEDFLVTSGFVLQAYYHTNKLYKKNITDYQILYVRIFSDVNTLQEVVYEEIPFSKFDKEGKITLETVTTLKKLKYLLKALS